MAIITISRQKGSLGDEIARVTAEKLGYEYIEKFQISKVLSSLGLSITDIDKYDEKKPSVWQTLTMQKEIFAHLIRAAVYELAARKNVVIAGRGGQVILKDVPGVLHVRVIASFAARVSRIMEQKGCDEKKAQRIIRQNDRDSSGYLSTYFDTDWGSSELYDLVINTRAMTLNESVDLITSAVEAERLKASVPAVETLIDLALTHKGKAALLRLSRSFGWVDLEVVQGVGMLSGIVDSPAEKLDCEKAVLNIQGVNSVDNQIAVRDESASVF